MLEFSATLTARAFHVSLTVPKGSIVAVMGPNGAGKSTLIQLLSGLLKPDAGRATLGSQVLFDVPQGLFMPPHARGLGVLAQDALLFPHLSVADNVAFGPRSRGAGKAASLLTAQHWLSEVDAVDFAARKPSALSGGQAQRVALARALATEPDLLLLDEPMSALDVDSVPFLRNLLKRVLAGRSAIIVTHHVLDALLLADELVILEAGNVVESGPVASVLAQPHSAFAASLAGLNVVTGTLLDGGSLDGASLDAGALGIVAGRAADGFINTSLNAQRETPGMAAFTPSAVSVFLEAPHGSPRNCFAVVVDVLEPQGDHVRVRAGTLAADVSPAAVAELALSPGKRVYFVVKAAAVAIYAL